MAPPAPTTKILIIGGTGFIGRFIVEASAKAGHPTFAFVRESSLSDPAKSPIIHEFNTLGVNFVVGDIHDHQSLVKAIKQADVVISIVNYEHTIDQYRIISAVKEAGNVKRFFPSEFGNDVDRTHAPNEAKELFDAKAQIRRTLETEGIPHTYVVANFCAKHFLPTWSHLGAPIASIDTVIIFGDGNTKAIHNKEEDIATYTVRTVDDPRTLNKILYIKPPANIMSYNDLVSLWEKKNGKILKRIYVPEEQIFKYIKESSFPINMGLAICYATYVKGDHINYEIESSFGVEASELYPDVKYTTLDKFIDDNDACTPFYLNMLINDSKKF